MVDNREIILAFIRQNGPILPAKVAKHLGMSLLMGSAHLAEMTATGKRQPATGHGARGTEEINHPGNP